MPIKRPTMLKFTGNIYADGRPESHLMAYGIPARSLDEAETAELSYEQIVIAMNSGLYEDASPKKEKPPKTEENSPKIKDAAEGESA